VKGPLDPRREGWAWPARAGRYPGRGFREGSGTRRGARGHRSRSSIMAAVQRTSRVAGTAAWTGSRVGPDPRAHPLPHPAARRSFRDAADLDFPAPSCGPPLVLAS